MVFNELKQFWRIGCRIAVIVGVVLVLLFSLNRNQIGDVGAKTLAGAAHENTSIKEL